MVNRVTCRSCGGKGKTISKKCKTCKGKGYNTKLKTIEVNIPAGILSGQQLRVPKKGGRGANGGPNGDLYIEIIVEEHKFFKQNGNDIYLEVPLSFIDAALGAEIDVPTIHGDVALKIPEGTQTDAVLRLKGKGINNGNQYVVIKLQTPTKLSKKTKDALEAVRKDDNDGFFTKFKKIFKK
jgi:molecular chaperone DnaJ